MAYLDHAATTPVLPDVVELMADLMSRVGNPSSLHASGRRARRTVEESRERLAAALGVRPSEVVFTSGGTESDNLAVKGIYWSRRAEDDRRKRVLVGAAEHHAVLDTAVWLGDHEGAVLEEIPVDSLGRVRPEALERAIGGDPDSVAVISVMQANNEVGTINDIAALAAIAVAGGIPLHTDAVQAVGTVPLDLAATGAAATTVTAHKLGGPIGVGALVLGRDVGCVPVLHGGGQERDVRSGTLDAPAVAALAFAVEIAVAEQPARAARIAALRDDLVVRVLAAVPDAQLNGDPDLAGRLGSAVPARLPGAAVPARLPGNAHFSFPGCEGDALLMLLDAHEVECSTGSACSAGVTQPSHVLLAMGHDDDRARSSLRFSLGHTSTAADVAALATVIGPAVERARAAGLPR